MENYLVGLTLGSRQGGAHIVPPNLVHNMIKEVTCYNVAQRQRKNMVVFSSLQCVHRKNSLAKAIFKAVDNARFLRISAFPLTFFAPPPT